MSTNIKIGIDGMHCAACSARVEKALGALKGVKAAHVNLALEEASLEVEPGRVSREQIEKTILSLGFSVREELSKDEDRLILEAREARKRMWHIWLITIVVSIFMVAHMFFDTHILSSGADGWIVFLLTLYAMLFPARNVYRSAFMSLKTGSANMDVLIAIGTLASLLVWPLSFLVKDIDPHAFSGIAAMILAIHHTGRYLESRARGKASEAIRKLMNLGAKTAILLEDGVEREVSIRRVQPGDILIVKAGMKIPTDAVIIEGKANIDEAMVTGESMPVTRTAGERVLGATLNVNGYLKLKAEKVGEDTFLTQVIRLVQDAQHSKVPVQLLADKITAVFVPIVIVLAVLTFAFWLLFPDTAQNISIAILSVIPLKDPNHLPTGLAAALMASIATLVIACPCALGLATPTALMVGSGMGAKRGILIRNSEALQLMKDVKAIIFDKTGTLTHGKPEVIEIHLETLDETIALGIAASLEAGSSHPLAIALIKGAEEAGAITSEVQDFVEHVGQGVSASLDGTRYMLGSRKFMESAGLTVPEKTFEADYASRVYLADEDRVLAIFLIADALRDNARQVVTQLKQRGITSIMISGDNPATAKAIAAQLGITRFHAQALPEDKAILVTQLKQEFGTVAMVGDGINDAPALKTADIGIAMGQGTDIAIEAADITIVRDDLACLPTAVELSIQTFKKIRQNLFWAFSYNLIAIPLAVFGVLHPVISEIAMAGSSVTVVTNANLLRRKVK
jgi:Cu+-exporting ATPase